MEEGVKKILVSHKERGGEGGGKVFWNKFVILRGVRPEGIYFGLEDRCATPFGEKALWYLWI